MSSVVSYSPGSIVTCRNRQWIVLPSDSQDLIRLRPLSGDEEQICGILPQLNLEQIEEALFPQPEAKDIQDHTAARLLHNAARLSLRSGAGPFRCLGRLSVRPRPYQLVPLLMALRLETVRLLIADDVGIGKTIEAGLVARELLDRAEVKRIAVLCPPQFCDQWQRELKQKFHIDAVVVRSGTVSKLERGLPAGDHHVFSYYPHLVVSLDYAKSDRRRASFLAYCPDFIIVDEAHTCASSGSTTQQQRHQLIAQIAARSEQHLLLLTATPHSGIEASFVSLLGLLQPHFGDWSLESLTSDQRTELARHFVQRRRVDVRQWLGDTTPFPERETLEAAYSLSTNYGELFDAVYDFARGLVKTGEASLSHAQRRGRYWSALAIIRCVMSSPAAAIATLSQQIRKREAHAQETEGGVEYWLARDLQELLGYVQWRNFKRVIDDAKIACEASGHEVSDHFADVSKMVQIGSGTKRRVPDLMLTRFACYLIAQNGDPNKPTIAFAQTYFALQTRRAELIQQRINESERVMARQDLKSTEKELSKVIFEHTGSDKNFGLIRSKGDTALFGRPTKQMKATWKVPDNRPLADFAPTIILSAKKLAAEITIHNTRANDFTTEPEISDEHVTNNSAIRQTLLERGIRPESLPPAEDVKKVERRLKSAEKKSLKNPEKLD